MKSIISAVVLFGLVSLVFVLFRPDGQLILAIPEHLKDKQSEIRAVFEKSYSRIPQSEKNHYLISLQKNTKYKNNEVFIKRIRPGQLTLKDTINIEAKIKIEYFTGTFSVTNIIDQLYRWVGWEYNYFIVNNYKSKRSEKKEPELEFSAYLQLADSNQYKQFRNEKQTTKVVIDNISRFLYSNFLDKKKINNLGFAPINEITAHSGSLDLTARSFSVLQHGLNHFKCADLDEIKCLNHARSLVKEALRLNKSNAHAHFALGLINMRSAIDELSRNRQAGSAPLIKMAWASQRITNSLYNSSFLLKKLRDHPKVGFFSILKHEDMPLDRIFLKTAVNYRLAFDSFRKAEYDHALEYLKNIKNEPPIVSTRTKLLVWSIKLEREKNRKLSVNMLDEFQLEFKKIFSSGRSKYSNYDQSNKWIFDAVYGIHSCYWREKKRRPLQYIKSGLSGYKGKQSSVYWSGLGVIAWCNARLGNNTEAKRAASRIAAHIENLANWKKPSYSNVIWQLAVILVELKKYEDARIFIEYCIKQDDMYFSRLLDSKFLSSLRENAPNLFEEIRGSYHP